METFLLFLLPFSPDVKEKPELVYFGPMVRFSPLPLF